MSAPTPPPPPTKPSGDPVARSGKGLAGVPLTRGDDPAHSGIIRGRMAARASKNSASDKWQREDVMDEEHGSECVNTVIQLERRNGIL